MKWAFPTTAAPMRKEKKSIGKMAFAPFTASFDTAFAN